MGRKIGERPQDEGPTCKPRVRQGCPARAAGRDLAVEIQQIQVDKPGGVGHGSDSAEGLLDDMHLG